MEPLKIGEVANIVKGRVITDNNCLLDVDVKDVVIDSRSVSNSSLFVPIRGQKVDAHNFINTAFEAGALCSFSQKNISPPSNKVIILVEDTKKALQDLAAHYRKQFSIPVIGVTGSVGKTSTKEMIASALSVKYNVYKTFGNQNSQIGLPLTILGLEKRHQVAVIEMGISEFHEMESLSRIANPTHAVITNIGVSHIENLHTRENILSEKLHIIDGFTDKGKLYLNLDNDMLCKAIDKINHKVVTFGKNLNCNFCALKITNTPYGTNFMLKHKDETYKIDVLAFGEHNVMNALCAVAISFDLGLSIEEIKAGISSYRSPKMRGEIYNIDGITIIDDSYNSSPDALKSSISILNSINNIGRKILVVADILELGEKSKEIHKQIGKYAALHNIDCIITIGKFAKYIAITAKDTNTATYTMSFSSNKEASEFLFNFIKSSDTILVKGSRSMHTEEVVNDLIKYLKRI